MSLSASTVVEAQERQFDKEHQNAIGERKTPRGYADFDEGVAKTFVLDPHGSLKNVA